MPITGAKNHRDDHGCAILMALHRTAHFLVIAIIRSKEVGTDQKQDDIVRLDMLVDCRGPFRSGVDPAVVPCLDHALPFQHRELSFQLIAQRLVGVGIGEKDADQ